LAAADLSSNVDNAAYVLRGEVRVADEVVVVMLLLGLRSPLRACRVLSSAIDLIVFVTNKIYGSATARAPRANCPKRARTDVIKILRMR